jgi:hypothetical protein
MARELPNVAAWDGHSWRSTIALIVVFIVNGLFASPLALVLGVWASLGNSGSLAAGVSTNLFLAGLATMAFVSIREQSKAGQRLRWIAITLNGALIGLGTIAWAARMNAASGELFPIDALALIAIAAVNLACIAMSRQFFVGRACPSCGYDLRSLRRSGCPECGWRRETSTS